MANPWERHAARPVPAASSPPPGKPWERYASPPPRPLAGISPLRPAPLPEPVPGNINLHDRPHVSNSDGSISTVRSISFGMDDGREVLVPTVSDDGRIMSDEEAWAQYERTGRHLGIFNSPDEATAYANSLHEEQAAEYLDPPAPAPRHPNLLERAVRLQSRIPFPVAQQAGQALSLLLPDSNVGLLDEAGQDRFVQRQYGEAERSLEAAQGMQAGLPDRVARAHTPTEARIAAGQAERVAARVARAQDRLGSIAMMAEGQAPSAAMTAMRSSAAGAAQSLLRSFSEAPLKAVGVLQSIAAPIHGQPMPQPEDTPAYRAGAAAGRAIGETFPTDAPRAGTFAQQLGEGVGSMAAFAGPGAWLKAAGAAPAVSTAVMAGMGAVQQGSAGLDEAIEADATLGQKMRAFGFNAALGATEAIPTSRLFGRLESASGGMFSRILRESAANSAEEFGQEVFQSIGSDVVARALAGYDPNREIGENALQQGAIGAFLGGLMGAGGGMVAGPGPALRREEPAAPAEEAAPVGKPWERYAGQDEDMRRPVPEDEGSAPAAPVEPEIPQVQPQSRDAEEVPQEGISEIEIRDIRDVDPETMGAALAPGQEGVYLLERGEPQAIVIFRQEGDELRIDNIQYAGADPQYAQTPENAANSLGPARVRALVRWASERYPNATAIIGERISGARNGGERVEADQAPAVRIPLRARPGVLGPVAPETAPAAPPVDRLRPLSADEDADVRRALERMGSPTARAGAPGPTGTPLDNILTRADMERAVPRRPPLEGERQETDDPRFQEPGYLPRSVPNLENVPATPARGVATPLDRPGPAQAGPPATNAPAVRNAIDAAALTRTVDGAQVMLPDPLHAALFDYAAALERSKGGSQENLAAKAKPLFEAFRGLVNASQEGEAFRTPGAVNGLAQDYVEMVREAAAAGEAIPDVLDSDESRIEFQRRGYGAVAMPTPASTPPPRSVLEALATAAPADLGPVRTLEDMETETAQRALAAPETRDIQAQALDARRTAKDRRSTDLTQFVRSEGGVVDEGGDLRSALDRTQPGLVANKRGRRLDEMALRAWEAGYFPEWGATRPDANAFINALVEDANGRAKRYSAEDDSTAQQQESAQSVLTWLDREGVDMRGSDEDVLHAVSRLVQPEGETATLADRDRQRDDMRAAGVFATTGFASGSQRPAGGIAAPAAPATESDVLEGAPRATVEKIVNLERKLARALGLTSRTGLVALRKAVGTYNRGSGVIRRRANLGNEIAVLTHEAGHHLEFNPTVAEGLRKILPGVLDAHAAELKPMAYAGAKKGTERSEGFAEFLRYYVTEPDVARSRAPRFYEAFEKTMKAENPKALAALQEVRDAWSTYLNAPSTDAAKAHIVSRRSQLTESTAVSRALETDNFYTVVDTLRRDIEDKNHALKQAVRAMSRGGAEPKGQADNPYDLQMISDHSAQMAGADLKYGVMSYDQSSRGEASMAEAFRVAFGGKKPSQLQVEDFDAYLTMRRAQEDYRRMAEGKMDKPFPMEKGDVDQAVQDFEAQNPTFRDASKIIHQFHRDALTLLRDAGLISQESFDRIDAARTFYVPAHRARGGYEAFGASNLGNNRSPILKRARGSLRSVISPLEMTASLAGAMRKKVEQNRVLTAMKELAAETGDGGRVFERLPVNEANKLRLDTQQALDAVLQDLDVDPDTMEVLRATLDGVEALSGKIEVWTQKAAEYKGRPVMWVLEEGKPVPYLLPEGDFGRDLYATLALQAGQKDGPFSKILQAGFFYPALVVRNTVTMHPAFVLVNLMRDQIAAAMVATGRYIPFASAIKGGISFARNSESRKEYEAMGGIMGGQLADAVAPKSADDLVGLLTGKKGASSLFRTFAQASEWSELATRIGVYEEAKAQALRRGMSEQEARVSAIRTANDIADFSRHGASRAMTFIRRSIPFMNPWVQGLSKQARTVGPGAAAWVKHRKGEKLSATEQRQMEAFSRYAVGYTMLAVVSMMMEAALSDDEEFQEFTNYERARNWIFPLPNGEWFFYPKPFEHASGASIAERAWEGLVDGDPEAAANLLHDLRELYSPPGVVPVPLKIAIEQGMNREMFSGFPIVPSGTETLQPIDQFSDYTSPPLVDAVQRLEEWTGFQMSPARIQHVMLSLSTSWGRDAIGVSRAVTGELPGPSSWPIAQRLIKPFYRSAVTDLRYWNDMAEDGSLSRAERSYKRALSDNGPAAAWSVLNRRSMDRREQEYALSQTVWEGFNARHHPMRWANEMRRQVQPIQRGLRDDQSLNAAQRGALTAQLGELMLWQKRAALILTEHPDNADDDLETVETRMADSLLAIAAISPEVADRLSRSMNARTSSGAPRFPTYAQVKTQWPVMRDRMDGLLNDEERLARTVANR